MTDEREPFRLEDDPEEPPRREPREGVGDLPGGPASPDGNGRGFEGEATSPPSAPPPGRREWASEDTVDERTLAEKQGRAVGVVSGRRPDPLHWPSEAFLFPFRRPGRVTMVSGTGFWVLLDLAECGNFFLGLFLKVLVVPLFLRWQFHVASMTAGGQDEPASWGSAMDLTRGQIWGIARFLVAAVLLLAPGAIAAALERPVLGFVLLVLGSLWLAAGALGEAVGDPSFLRPWNAVAWVGRRPLGLLASTVGWWAAGFIEVAVYALSDAPLLLALLASVAMRLVFLYLWLVSARALGVVGRAWSPWADEDGDQAGPGATSPAG